MIRIQLRGSNIIISCVFLSIFTSCNSLPIKNHVFAEVPLTGTDLSFTEYNEFCRLDRQAGNYELNAVECSLFGDYKGAIEQATKDASEVVEESGTHHGITGQLPNIEEVEAMIQDKNTSEDERTMATHIKSLILAPKSIEAYYSRTRSINAVEYVADRSRDFHFTLINEAHYCSQHREFTSRLLKPLWDNGYRYLALETASILDSTINERGYPIGISGYYCRDSNFGNMMRAAMDIGFQIIPYETETNNRGSSRDLDQARNILDRTWEQDKKGKVLVHAGYSHINELGGDSYQPMGYHLKRLLNKDVFTVDQVSMTWLDNDDKLHPYYKYVSDNFNLSSPIVIIDSIGQPITELLLSNSVDVQVYHPQSHFIQQRPDWLINGRVLVQLPEYIQAHEGKWLRVLVQGESEDAIPVDQFIIAKDAAIVLGSHGEYLIQIVDCDGYLSNLYTLSI